MRKLITLLLLMTCYSAIHAKVGDMGEMGKIIYEAPLAMYSTFDEDGNESQHKGGLLVIERSNHGGIAVTVYSQSSEYVDFVLLIESKTKKRYQQQGPDMGLLKSRNYYFLTERETNDMGVSFCQLGLVPSGKFTPLTIGFALINYFGGSQIKVFAHIPYNDAVWNYLTQQFYNLF